MTWEAQLHSIGLVALAGLLGGLIGLEREIARKPAGIRTHIFVATASALMMVLGQAIVVSFQRVEEDHVISADPTRIIQAVAVGVSFLGAGTILHQRGRRVEGLTTASSILFTSGIGLGVAMHQFVLAVGLTLLAIVVLQIVGRFESLFDKREQDAEAPSSSESPPSLRRHRKNPKGHR